MAIKKSAKKAHKRSLKNREVNLQFKLAMKKAIKTLLKAIEAKEEASKLNELLILAYSKIDKAAKRGVIKKQNAARRKSRLIKKVLALTA